MRRRKQKGSEWIKDIVSSYQWSRYIGPQGEQNYQKSTLVQGPW